MNSYSLLHPMDLSLVIVSYNTRDLLRKCLMAIPAACDELETEVFVVDNASPDGSAEMVRLDFPHVNLTASTENLGFSRANNLALEGVRGDYVVLLNPDTEAAPESLKTMVDFLRANPLAGACGPKLLNTDGTVQRNGARFPRPLREFLGVTGLRRINMRAYEVALGYGREDFDLLCEVDQVSGACIMVPREILTTVGGLDDRFFMFYEEIDWCYRIRASGHSVWYLPEAVVIHHWMGSVKQASRAMTAQLFRSQLLYYQKHGTWLSVMAVRGIMLMGLAKNSLLHLGVAVKRGLRRMKLLAERPA